MRCLMEEQVSDVNYNNQGTLETSLTDDYDDNDEEASLGDEDNDIRHADDDDDGDDDDDDDYDDDVSGCLE